MKQTSIKRRCLRILACAVLLGSGQAFGAGDINEEADKVLKAMSSYLGSLKTVSFDADIDLEVVTKEGQKIQMSSYSTALMERPAKLRIDRKGMLAEVKFIYDGKTLSVYGEKQNVYASLDAPGNIDDAILAYEAQTGLPAPGADLLFANTYGLLTQDTTQGSYIGISYIDGIPCHHLAFREDEVDWQLWVQEGDTPLPMKYVITSKWQNAAPQYEIRYRNWNTDAKIPKDAFVFTPPKDALDLGSIQVDEIGELLSTKEAN